MEASQDNCTLLEVIAPLPDLGAIVENRLIGGADVVLVRAIDVEGCLVSRLERERAWSGSW